MKASSYIKLDKQALKANWDFLREYFPGKRISAVVKGNAYGHGIEDYVPIAEECGVDHFSVFNAGEAYKVHSVASPGTTLMIMGALDENDVEWSITNGVEFYVFNFERLQLAQELARQIGKKALIHIEIETGMYRTGFEIDQIPDLAAKLKAHSAEIVFKGLCMHFAGAEHITNNSRVKEQEAKFMTAIAKFRELGLEPEMIHTCCSAAAIRLPEMQYDLLRIGIMQYGFWPSPEILIEYLNKTGVEKSPLKRVLSWESMVMSVKQIPAGAYVGYGSSFFAHRSIRIAVVPVGYAHGFSRGLSNTGIVLVNGWRAPVVGIVNMNCIAIDITHIPDVKLNDTVTMIGSQGEHEISVASFGEMTNQLNYELLTRLPMNITRQVV